MNILTIKQASKEITLIATAGRKMDERIHTVAVSGLAHFFEHGDTTTLSKLCQAMPKSARGNALKYWITKHAPVKFVAKAAGFKKNGDIPENFGEVLEQAASEPFYNKEDKEPSVFDETKYLKTVVSKLKKENVNIAEFVAKLQVA